MPQWNPKSLTALLCVSTAFLFLFNYFASFMGTYKYSASFEPTSNGFSLNVKNLTLFNFPISIVGYSENQTVKFKTTIYGDSKPLYNEKPISLSSSFTIGIRQYYSNYQIFIEPLIPNTSLFLELHNPVLNILTQIFRYIFIILIFVSFSALFNAGKNFSVMRSVLIIQITVIFMLDPLHILVMCFPSLKFLTYFIFSFAWYKCSIEIFNEYTVLVRHNSFIFKFLLLIPFSCQILLYIMKSFDQRNLLKIFIGIVSTLTGFDVAALGCHFIIKLGKTTGRSSLIIHIVTSVIVLSLVYFISIMNYAYDREISFSFSGSFLSHTLQISFLGIFALFQTVFQAGEMDDESEQYLPRQLTQRKDGQKFEKIEELLESLESINDEVKFEIPES